VIEAWYPDRKMAMQSRPCCTGRQSVGKTDLDVSRSADGIPTAQVERWQREWTIDVQREAQRRLSLVRCDEYQPLFRSVRLSYTTFKLSDLVAKPTKLESTIQHMPRRVLVRLNSRTRCA